MSSNNNVRNNQTGLVSIMVTIIMMLVISLIVLGFATVTRRNSREALDRQLNTQAYYAAETGINDVMSALNLNKISDTTLVTPTYATDCNGINSLMTKLGNVNGVANQNWLNNDGSVQYSCLLANPFPASLIINVPAADTENTFVNPSAATNLTFTWQTQGSTGSATGCPTTLQPQASWTGACPYGILRLDIFKVTAGDADTAAANTASVFLLPSTGGAPPTAIQYDAPTIVKATCSDTAIPATPAKTCSAVLTDAGGVKFNGSYYVRLSNVYRASGNVVISPQNAGGPVTFKDSQILIDVTGKAQDEIRRIQERISPADKVTPEILNAISSGTTVCKRFTIQGSGTTATPANLCAP